MTAKQAIALMRYNARRCALSRSPSRLCRCRCAGLHHGQVHPTPWLSEQAARIREAYAPGVVDLPGFAQ